MATADELIIKIRADMRDIERKLDGLERESGQTSRTMQRHFQRAAQGINNAFRNIRGPALAATAAGTGFAFMAQRSLEAVEAISDLSTRANVSAEFLQEMRFAINQSGGSARDFDDAISRLNRRFGLFLQNLRTGEGEAGPAAAAFRALGIETRIVSGELTDAEGVFNAAVQGLSEVESAAQRSALASQLFGEDSGPRLVALLDRGITGINGLRGAAREAGAVLENDLVAQGSAASDQLEIMSNVLQTQFNRAIVENSAGLLDFARAFSQVVTASVEAIASVGTFIRYVNIGIGGMAFEPITEDAIREQRERAGELLQIYTNRLQNNAAGGVNFMSLRQVLPADDVERLSRSSGNAMELMGNVVTALAERYRDLGVRLREVAETAGDVPAALAAGAGGGGGASTPTIPSQVFGGLPAEAAASADSLINLAEQIKAAMNEAKLGIPEVVDELDRMKIEIDAISDGAIKSLEDAFVDFVRTGRFEVASLVDYMIEQFARLAFQNTIGNALDGLFGSIFGAVLGGPAGAAAGLASGISGKIAGAPALQVAAAGSQARTIGMASARGVSILQPITIDARGADAGVEDRIRRVFADQGPALQQQTMRATIEAIGRINGAGRVQN
jgi:hypothetical protein